jgi:ABC-type nickel/cobalt efflux system permease component RcnA
MLIELGVERPKKKVQWMHFTAGVIFVLFIAYFISFCFWGNPPVWTMIMTIVMAIIDLGAAVYNFSKAFSDWILEWLKKQKAKIKAQQIQEANEKEENT